MSSFTPQQLKEIFHIVEENKSGLNAQYIPQLAQVDPDQFGVSVCSVDGQVLGSLCSCRTYYSCEMVSMLLVKGLFSRVVFFINPVLELR